MTYRAVRPLVLLVQILHLEARRAPAEVDVHLALDVDLAGAREHANTAGLEPSVAAVAHAAEERAGAAGCRAGLAAARRRRLLADLANVVAGVERRKQTVDVDCTEAGPHVSTASKENNVTVAADSLWTVMNSRTMAQIWSGRMISCSDEGTVRMHLRDIGVWRTHNDRLHEDDGPAINSGLVREPTPRRRQTSLTL